MDEASLSGFTLIAALIGLHALIVLSYAAVASPRAAMRREDDDDRSPSPKRLTRLRENLLQTQIAAKLALTLARVTIFAVATVMIKHPLLDLPAEIQAWMVPVVSYGIVLVPLALLVYVLGDLVPSAVGRTKADALAPWGAILLHGLIVLFSPLLRVLMLIDATLARVSGGSNVAVMVTDEEILSLVDVGQRGGAIETDEKEMIRSVLEFGETLVREVMVPRLDVTALSIDATLDEALETFVESGHSRVPVYDDTIDNIRGVLYAKDLLTILKNGRLENRTAGDLMRPAYFVPETKRADTLFKEMQGNKVHLAIVVDEYGGTAGLVTLEDLVEEIVGDIQDEYDVNEEAESVQHGEHEFTFEASINLDDFNNLMHASLSTEDNDTLGGFIFDLLGRVPEAGETVEVTEDESKLIMRIMSVEGRRIRKVHVTRVPNQPPDADASASPNGTGATEAASGVNRAVASKAAHS